MTEPASDASKAIDARIAELDDWRGEALAQARALILEADPGIVEEWKWVKSTSPGVAVWALDGGICTGEVYKAAVKLTFFKGASLPDPQGLFNASLEAGTRRAIDIHEGERLAAPAFQALIRAAAAANTADRASKQPRRRS